MKYHRVPVERFTQVWKTGVTYRINCEGCKWPILVINLSVIRPVVMRSRVLRPDRGMDTKVCKEFADQVITWLKLKGHIQ